MANRKGYMDISLIVYQEEYIDMSEEIYRIIIQIDRGTVFQYKYMYQGVFSSGLQCSACLSGQ